MAARWLLRYSAWLLDANFIAQRSGTFVRTVEPQGLVNMQARLLDLSRSQERLAERDSGVHEVLGVSNSISKLLDRAIHLVALESAIAEVVVSKAEGRFQLDGSKVAAFGR